MYREKIQELAAWKVSKRRKPMLLLGARQVGKTWLMKEFGRAHYDEIAYVRFDRPSAMRDSFEQDSQVDRLLDDIRAYTGRRLEPGKSLIILDEIQDCPPVIATLKFFCEEVPEQHIIAAGSLLGLAMAGGTGFPVGKVDQLELFPMTFTEFLAAVGEEGLVRTLRAHKWTALNRLSDRLEHLLRIYYFVGGMPEAVSIYAETRDYTAVRRYQTAILRDYRNDFAKHVGSGEASRRIASVWDIIPLQLAQENRQFQPKNAESGGMPLRQTRMPLQWLSDAGLIHTVRRVRVAEAPLSGYADNAFKVYSTDVGLLAAQSGLERRTLLEKNTVFAQYKGALTEQYVMQQLLATGFPELYYWKAAQAQAEVDFIASVGGGIVPIEVKAERNLMAKSLKSYCKRYAPSVAVRCSMAPYAIHKPTDGDGMNCPLMDIPLWAVNELHRILDKEPSH